MNPVSLAFMFVLATHPHEYHIDCTGWNGGAVIRFIVRLTPAHGVPVEVEAELQPEVGQEIARHVIWSALDDDGWHTRKIGKGILIVESAKASSPVLWVESTSKQWKPGVTLVFK